MEEEEEEECERRWGREEEQEGRRKMNTHSCLSFTMQSNADLLQKEPAHIWSCFENSFRWIWNFTNFLPK